jgi:DNA-binding NtrC family response regulator
VRELRNVVTSAVIHARDYAIAAGDLGLAGRVADEGGRGSGDLSLDGLERDAIMEALRKTGGRCQRAADLLGISRRTLSRKLKQYGPAVREESLTYEEVSG